MQKNVDAAKTLTPSKAEKLTGDERAKYLKTYKKNLDELSTEIAALKQAIDSGASDKAKAALDKIGQLKNSSHKELGVNAGGGPRRSGGLPPDAPLQSLPQPQ